MKTWVRSFLSRDWQRTQPLNRIAAPVPVPILEVWVAEYKTKNDPEWRVSEVFESQRIAQATCDDSNERDPRYDDLGFVYRVRRYVPASELESERDSNGSLQSRLALDLNKAESLLSSEREAHAREMQELQSLLKRIRKADQTSGDYILLSEKLVEMRAEIDAALEPTQ